MYLLFTHLLGNVLRHALYGTTTYFGQQLVSGRLVGDGYASSEVLPQICRHLLCCTHLHGAGYEDARLSVIVVDGKFYGYDRSVMLHLKNLDVESFTFDAAFARDEGVAWQYILPDTHRLQEPEPHTLTARDGLVAMHARLDGVACVLHRCCTYGSVETAAYGLSHPCYHHRVAHRLGKCRYHGL